MITSDQITSIGKFAKPHGINGEVSATINALADELKRFSCIICAIDGIYVPFFIKDIRTKSQETFLLTIDGINDEQEASVIVNKEIFVLREEYKEIMGNDEELPVDFFLNFKAIINNIYTGTIVDIDTTTVNVLFVVKMDNGEEKLIPAVDDFVSAIDEDKRIIELNVPEALLEL